LDGYSYPPIRTECNNITVGKSVTSSGANFTIAVRVGDVSELSSA
jgi:putative methionine-R-sulfoxide reductase with GAF domain